MLHAVLEMRLIIKQNDAIWKANEHKEILQCTLKIYLGRKMRKCKLHSSWPSVPNTLIEIHTSEEDSTSDLTNLRITLTLKILTAIVHLMII